jgi:hypothetical protein
MRKGYFWENSEIGRELHVISVRGMIKIGRTFMECEGVGTSGVCEVRKGVEIHM